MIKRIHDFNLEAVTTFALPAKCRCFIEYDKVDDIPEVYGSLPHGAPCVSIGEGSNLLFTRDFDGYVIHGALKGCETICDDGKEITIRVLSGVRMDDLIRDTASQGLWGLENLSGIPGEAGASAVQNVGAYGVEAGNLIRQVNVFDREKNVFTTFSHDACGYAYRDSVFKHEGYRGRYVIWSVDYVLSHVPCPVLDYPALNYLKDCHGLTPMNVREAVLAIRSTKLPDPAEVPSAGSFFKNPVISDESLANLIAKEGNDSFPHFRCDGGWKVPAAWLIDRCGWKGKRLGNAGVWHLQPLVIVNPDRKASGKDILELENRIIDSVYSTYGIKLQPEVEHI